MGLPSSLELPESNPLENADGRVKFYRPALTSYRVLSRARGCGRQLEESQLADLTQRLGGTHHVAGGHHDAFTSGALDRSQR
jgi:hypothetical protein